MPRGFRIGYPRNYRLWGELGSYTVNGKDASVGRHIPLVAAGGFYVSTGQNAAFSTNGGTVVQPPTTDNDFPQYTINTDVKLASEACGMSGMWWSQELQIHWWGYYQSRMQGTPDWMLGDWLDANDVPNDIEKGQAQTGITFTSYDNGGAARTIASTFAAGQWIDFDATTLVQRWLTSGHNRGAYIRSTGSLSGYIDFAGRLFVDGNGITRPPTLVVTTTSGTYTLTGMLGGFAINSTSQIDTSLQARAAPNRALIVHFRDLPTVVTGTVTSATLKMWVVSKSMTNAISLWLFQANPPYVWVGGGGRPVTWGLAKTAWEQGKGEDNQPAMRTLPEVVLAGDFKFDNWWNRVEADGTYSVNPALGLPPCGEADNKMDARPVVPWVDPMPPRAYAGELIDDTEVPYTSKALRWWFLYHGRDGVTAGPRYEKRMTKPLPDDPTRRINSAAGSNELYARCYFKFEAPYYASSTGIKHGVAPHVWYGHWSPTVKEWTRIAGNSGSVSTGKATLYPQGSSIPRVTGTVTNPEGQWAYEGHSIRGHSLTGPDTPTSPNSNPPPRGRAHEGYVKLAVMPSHLGPLFFDKSPYGTEDTVPTMMNNQATVMKQGRWHCVETYMKVNTISPDPALVAAGGTGYDQYGNGIANPDGILRIYVDGVLAWEKTNYRFVCHPDMKIEGPMLDSMHGGTDAPRADHIPPPTHQWNHYVSATRYIGPNTMHAATKYISYPAGVAPPEPVPATTGDLTALTAEADVPAMTANTWKSLESLKPGTAWAVRSMIPGVRDATPEQVGAPDDPAWPGNFNALADDTLTNSNGIAWDPLKKQIFFTMGGHGGYPGNEVYCVDLQSRRWVRLNDPSPLTYAPYMSGSVEVDNWDTTDGTPKSAHTYDGIVHVPGHNAFYMLHGSPFPQGNYIGDLWKFDLGTRRWTKLLDQPMGKPAYIPHLYWVESEQKILMGWRRWWRWYDPATNTTGPLTYTNAADTGISSGCVTPTGLYQFHNSGVDFLPFASVGTAAPTNVTPAAWSNLGTLWSNYICWRWNSYLWDPVRQMVIAWSNRQNTTDGGKRVFALDFANGKLYEFVQPANGFFPYCEALGAFSKWVYMPEWDAYMGLNNRAINNGWCVFKPGTMTLLAG